MKLSKLRINNFRCFTDIELELNKQLTVLVAENGQGKSALLDAIRIGLWPFVSSFDLARSAFNPPGNAIAISDVRLVRLSDGDMARQLPTEVALTGDFGMGSSDTWIRYRDSEAKATKTKDDGDTSKMKNWSAAVQAQIRNPDKPTLDLPVFGYYGTGRLWAQKRLIEKPKGKDDTQDPDFYIRTFGYVNCLDPASSYKHFKEWFIWAYESLREQQINKLEGRANEEELVAAQGRIRVVQQAIDTFLKPITGWHTLEYSISREKSLILHHEDQGTLDVEQLSDGIRSVLAMVGDIAYRCIKLNPHMGVNAARETIGVVMIDEVDMHLHPRWQQVVLGQLQEAFQEIQFIVTTHSPQVLSTVRRENIRILSDNGSSQPLGRTYGEPSGDVMQSVMDVDPQPPVAERKDLQRLTELVDQGMYDEPEATELTQRLTAALGGQHPQLQRLQRSIKRQKALQG